jgi:sulfide:quinone oxidoreductase
MSRVLILGGGFGGLAAAHALRSLLAPSDEVVLVERQPTFVMGLRKSWALVGSGDLASGERRLDGLTGRGIEVVTGEITAIEPEAKAAVVDGRRLAGEALVVALGAARAPESVPGFAEHVHNVYELSSLARAAQALHSIEGGAVAIGIFAVPYTCPPAPYEMAFLVNDLLRRRGVPASVEVFTPQPMSLPVIGQAGCDVLEARLSEEGINFHPNHQAVAVEADEVVFSGGRRRFDLLLGVPPHRCPAVAASAGLTDGGSWVKVNPSTMETRFSGVYAIGDLVEIPLANKMMLPKAGVFAESQAQVAAFHIAAAFSGGTASASFTGEGYCYLEVGRGLAMEVRGDFLAQPAPVVSIGAPLASRLNEKREFEATRLKKWFDAE